MSYHDYEDIDQRRPLDQFERWDWLDRHENMHLFMRDGKIVELPPQRAEEDEFDHVNFMKGLITCMIAGACFWFAVWYRFIR